MWAAPPLRRPRRTWHRTASTWSVTTPTRAARCTPKSSAPTRLVDCRLTDPLYSADGTTVIAEAGDKLTGEQTVQVGPGETSVFTTWTELETRSGSRAKLDSLGAGPMGASGTEAGSIVTTCSALAVR
ncbi:hypothetical protein CFN58_34590 [Pseudomonas avellanae]|uniref:Uncharacterized protein n=1 Tax=Pseudomonas avellanae TaxID=46257 RepID=A0A261WAL2_9PSED|nr:hypothetical protein CFN58_34590 [Pseudomonas avellanae]